MVREEKKRVFVTGDIEVRLLVLLRVVAREELDIVGRAADFKRQLAAADGRVQRLHHQRSHVDLQLPGPGQ